MRRLRWSWLPWLVVVVACAAEDEPVNVSLGPSLVFPRGILDQVTRLTLRVYGAGAGCDADVGTVNGDTSQLLVEQELGEGGCAAGARFCGDIVVRRSTTPYVFAAVAESENGKVLANGCAVELADEPRRALSIQMHRFIEPRDCGNGTLQPTETCDPPQSPDKSVCDDSCNTLEVKLSEGRGPGGTSDGQPRDKKQPVALWLTGSGASGKNFVTVFGDHSPPTREITMRVRSDAFGRFAAQGPEVADYSFFMPHTPGADFPPTEQPGNQTSPAAVAVGSQTWIAYEDDDGGNIDIRLRSVDATMTAEQSGGPLPVNGPTATGEPGDQTLPAIAANSQGILFIAWQGSDGSIQGRTFNPADGTRGSPRVLSTGLGNKNVRVIGRDTGFVAVWEFGASDIKLALLSPDGTPDPEQKVNAPARVGPVSHPDVAVLPDKRFAVTYSDRGAIFVQRFAADGSAIAGDQDAAVNVRFADGDHFTPCIAGSAAAEGSYVVAWAFGGDILAAYLGGSGGTLFNPLDSEAAEFTASAKAGRNRANPAIAIGGAGPHVVIVWEDTTSDAAAGIYGRRLPLPTL